MKKRIIAIILLLAMIVMPQLKVNAQAVDTGNQSMESTYSEWAQDELLLGSTYGLYPDSWSNSDMKKPITEAKFRVLLGGFKNKMLNTGCVVDTNRYTLELNTMSVNEVLNAFYAVISSYEFTKEISLTEDVTPAEYMKECNVYTGEGEELGLQEVCTVEQACVFATRLVTYLYDELDAASKGFLWEINNGQNKVYLLGSIHKASYDIYPFSNRMLEAYNNSDALVVEVNLFDLLGMMSYTALTVYSDGTTLKDHISEETYKETVQMAEFLGLSEEEIAIYKPWYINSLFTNISTTETGTSEEATQAALLGIDVNFLMNAMQQGKPIAEIEGYEYQGKVMDSFSDELQEYLLISSIYSLKSFIMNPVNNSSEGYDYIETALDQWNKGDVEGFRETSSMDSSLTEEAMASLSLEEQELLKEYTDKLITQRDKGMADYIDELLNAPGENTYFVVVGSAHYISDYSVLDILEEKGYTITQIK